MPTGATASVLRIAYIGPPPAQFVPLLEPYPGLPVVKLDQPSLGAADPPGFTHATCIHWPACACAAKAPSARGDGGRDQRRTQPPDGSEVSIRAVREQPRRTGSRPARCVDVMGWRSRGRTARCRCGGLRDRGRPRQGRRVLAVSGRTLAIGGGGVLAAASSSRARRACESLRMSRCGGCLRRCGRGACSPRSAAAKSRQRAVGGPGRARTPPPRAPRVRARSRPRRGDGYAAGAGRRARWGSRYGVVREQVASLGDPVWTLARPLARRQSRRLLRGRRRSALRAARRVGGTG